ncbi:hypothetical protein ANN_21375 [Periplaneta americana]|uniref:Uncharacterized protein n=1 Tax=Periplaneta americana TaxID=6978 RepID=A0ABQ8SGA9_PERAM|nr:hypothetical protein ANN_21375 [Periplaneta americana]
MPSTWPGIEPATLGIEDQRYTNSPTRSTLYERMLDSFLHTLQEHEPISDIHFFITTRHRYSLQIFLIAVRISSMVVVTNSGVLMKQFVRPRAMKQTTCRNPKILKGQKETLAMR